MQAADVQREGGEPVGVVPEGVSSRRPRGRE